MIRQANELFLDQEQRFVSRGDSKPAKKNRLRGALFRRVALAHLQESNLI